MQTITNKQAAQVAGGAVADKELAPKQTQSDDIITTEVSGGDKGPGPKGP